MLRSALFLLGLFLMLFAALAIVTFPDALRAPIFAHASYAFRASYICTAFITLGLSCALIVRAVRVTPPMRGCYCPECNAASAASLRRTIRRKALARRIVRTARNVLAGLALAFLALASGAGAAAYGLAHPF